MEHSLELDVDRVANGASDAEVEVHANFSSSDTKSARKPSRAPPGPPTQDGELESWCQLLEGAPHLDGDDAPPVLGRPAEVGDGVDQLGVAAPDLLRRPPPHLP